MEWVSWSEMRHPRRVVVVFERLQALFVFSLAFILNIVGLICPYSGPDGCIRIIVELVPFGGSMVVLVAFYFVVELGRTRGSLHL